MFDEIVLGQRERLGSYTFTPEAIIAFARNYDPQPFHLSEEGGAATHFGGLVASGWHTGSVWMRMRVDQWQRMAADRAARGLPPRASGPSGGFKNLKWPRPVRAGDTITYYTENVAKRPLATRPGWGLVSSLNTGENQHGELVFAFDGSVFVPL